MATTPKTFTNTPAPATTAPGYKSPVTKTSSGGPKAPRGNQTFLFDRNSYMWMFAGLACILIGFALMSGGKSPDPHKFNYDEIYSFRRITLAPIVILIGFALEAYAIMKKRTDETNAA